MTISSIVINLKNKNLKEEVLKNIKAIKECEVITTHHDKIVSVVTTSNTDEQITIFRQIQQLQGVDDVAMIYTYDELDDDIKNLKNSSKVSKVLSNEVDTKDIVYSGSIHYKVK